MSINSCMTNFEATQAIRVESSKEELSSAATESGGTATSSAEGSQVENTGRELLMKDRAYKICREFLSGNWKSISSTDMVFKSVNGGMSNFLYYCSLPEPQTSFSSPSEPSEVLLRIYGPLHDGKNPHFTVTESVIFMMLSERKLGPKLYGIFPGGRLEEYIPARALTCRELHDPEISSIIAKKLAGVHTLQVPISKEPCWLFDIMQKWLDYIRNNTEVKIVPEEKKQLVKKLLSIDFESELQWLRTYLQKIRSPVVFCHNDLQEAAITSIPDLNSETGRAWEEVVKQGKVFLHQTDGGWTSEGNILLSGASKEVDEKRLVFIDYEYSSYNFSFPISTELYDFASRKVGKAGEESKSAERQKPTKRKIQVFPLF